MRHTHPTSLGAAAVLVVLTGGGRGTAFATPLDDMIRNVDDDEEALRAGELQRASAAPQVVYSNFSDGTTMLSRFGENAVKNYTMLCGGLYPAWQGDAARARSLQAELQGMLNDFNIVLASKRPVEGPYTMIMVGPGGTCRPGGAGGIAPLDCANRNPSNVCYDFNSQGSVTTMAQELGHTFGLEHNDVGCDVMGRGYARKPCASQKWGFVDMDGPILYPNGSVAPHSDCGNWPVQNSYQFMKKTLGGWPGGPHPDPNGAGESCTDIAGPVVSITRPADGSTVPPTFEVSADVSDDCAVRDVRIELPDMGLDATNTMAPYVWSLEGIGEAARLEIRITAVDRKSRQTTASVFVRVSASAVDAGPGLADAASDSGGGGAGGAGGGQSDAGGLDSGAGGGAGGTGGGGGKGGGCAVTPAPDGPHAGLLALAVVAGLVRRRRSRVSSPS